MNWSNNLEKLKLFIETKNILPMWETNRELKIFIKKNFQNKFGKDIQNLWNIFTNDEKYVHFFTLNIEEYKENINKLTEFVLKNKRKPKFKTAQTNKEEFILLKFWRQFKNRNTYLYHTNNGNDVQELYINFLKNPEINIYYIRDFKLWNSKLEKLKDYLKNNDYELPESGKIINWFKYQKKYCYKDNIIYGDEIINLWNDFLINFYLN